MNEAKHNGVRLWKDLQSQENTSDIYGQTTTAVVLVEQNIFINFHFFIWIAELGIYSLPEKSLPRGY